MIDAFRLVPVLTKAMPWIVSVGVHGAVLGGVLWAGQATDTAPTPVIQVEVIVLAEPSATPGGHVFKAADPVTNKSAAPPTAAHPPTGETKPRRRPVSDAVVAAIDESDRSATEGLPPARVDKTAPAKATAPEDTTAPLPRLDAPPPRHRPRAIPLTAGPPAAHPPPRPRARPAPDRPVLVAARPEPRDKPRSVIFQDTGDKALPSPTPPADTPARPAATQTAALPDATAPRLGTGAGNAAPRYPHVARENGWQGRVVLGVAVDATGHAGNVTIKTSSGHGVLDRAARDAVKAWRFHPATRLGRPVAGVVEVPVSFRLRE